MNRLAMGYVSYIVSLEMTLNERIGVLLWHTELQGFCIFKNS